MPFRISVLVFLNTINKEIITYYCYYCKRKSADGKTAGGFLADRFGAVRSAWVTLGASAILFLFASHPFSGVLAVFLFNMTMPVTLGALGRMLPGVKGFAFGTLTFALFVGLVPIIAWRSLTGLPNYSYSLMALLSAVLLHAGFRMGKIR